LSHEVWEARFASDPAIVGRTVRLNRENWDIIGVMPPNFRMMGMIPQVWTPLVITASDQTAEAHKNRSLLLFGRLKPGTTVEQARGEFVALARRATENFPESEKGWGAAVRTLPDFLVYSFGIRTGLSIMMTTVGFVLMIACANVAGLLLSRAAGRRKELAIRISLGAGRLRIARQLLTEGFVIAALGGSAGLLLSYWGIYFLRAGLAFNEVIRDVGIELDANVVLFTLAVSVLCALLCATVPALKAARIDPNAGLKDESRGSAGSRSQSRLRRVMVTAEIAMALFLLVGTVLLVRAISLVQREDLGFQADHLLTATATLDDARYKDSAKQVAFVQELLRSVNQVPGAEGVAVVSDLPATGTGSVPLRIKGRPDLPANQRVTTLDFVVSPDFFRVGRISLLRGRTFTELDNATAPRVLVVNQEFVRRNFKDEDPLGKQIQLEVGGKADWSQIVGVVGNVKSYSEKTGDDPEVYEPYFQRPAAAISLMVRSGADPNGLAADLRRAVTRVDSELPLAHVMSMRAVLDSQGGGDQLFGRILASFAILALILAAIGIYGLMAYSVGQRTHEIGIRMALGARSLDVLRMVLLQGMKMAAVGALIGFLLALPLPKLLNSVLYGIHISEPWAYFFVPATVLLTAMLATLVPARRAAQVDPMRALRQE